MLCIAVNVSIQITFRYDTIFFQTRLLATHGLAHLPQCDKIVVMDEVVMDEGRIVEMGIYDELMEKEGKLAEIIKSQNSSPAGKF